MKHIEQILQDDDVLPLPYYDRQGRPLRLLDWAALFENFEYKRIAKTRLWHGALVSTVWLGLDHRIGKGPPLIFETMLFAPDELMMRRYATEAEAAAGHEEVVREWRWRPLPVWWAFARDYWKRLRAAWRATS